MAQDFKETLQLPKTDFPMRAGLAQREPVRVAHWENIGLYEAIQRSRADAPAFVLHDGPPFTNGDVHIGTALNKVLKDITNRYKSLRGFRTPYVPGWDCHGLPIEQKVAREIQERGETVGTAGLRARCGDFSESWIARQTAQFKRLGVLADWKHQYKTKEPAFEADIMRTFAAFIEKGLVVRSKKPVYWSIPFETALAEAEVEYQQHVSPSIWVRFPVPEEEALAHGLPADKPLGIVIWTTTPGRSRATSRSPSTLSWNTQWSKWRAQGGALPCRQGAGRQVSRMWATARRRSLVSVLASSPAPDRGPGGTVIRSSTARRRWCSPTT